MTDGQKLKHLLRANEGARETVAKGRHPFGTILVVADGATVLLEHGNVDTVNRAEAVLARVAAGPVSEAEAEIAAWHRGFWQTGA